MSEPSNLAWHLVLKNKDQLQENRVMTVVAGLDILHHLKEMDYSKQSFS